MLQTMAMHSPEHRASLVNHNLRWIDWPHSHGDPTEYWNALGARKFIGGPRVLNSSELSPVFASPYMFARQVDHEVDPHVLRLYEVMDDPKVNKLYLVLEYMRRGDLMKIQQGDSKAYSCERLGEVDTWRVTRQVALGLLEYRVDD